MEIPAFYYYNAKFVPNKPNYLVTMSFHIIPKKQSMLGNVQTTFIDGTVEESSYEDLYQNTGENIIMNLSRQNGRKGIENIQEIVLNDLRECLMQFSRSGNYFALVKKTKGSQILEVYDSVDMHDCFKKMNNQQNLLSYQCYGSSKIICFDLRDKYVAVTSKDCVQIFSLQTKQLYLEYFIEEDKHIEILDVILDSRDNFKCQIACRCNGMTCIQIFDITEKKEKPRSISYINKIGDIVVKISDNLRDVIFSNGTEHYLLNDHKQMSYPYIKDKFVKNVLGYNNNFYLVACKDYDRDIDILCTEDNKFNASIKRNIEPGNISVYDMIKDNNLLKTLIRIGEHLYIDTIDLTKCIGHKPKDAIVESIAQKHYHSLSFSWPYFSYATKNNRVFILNSFNQNFVQRYELPRFVSKVCSTFLTETYDFYCIAETDSNEFHVYHIDLDRPDPEVQRILAYGFSQVDSKNVVGFHVRGSSKKETIDLNKTLQIFVQHENDLWAWKGEEIEKISQSVTTIQKFSDEQIFFQEENDNKSKIMKIMCGFSNYSMGFIYEDQDRRAEILNFSVDTTAKRLIILTGIKNSYQKRDKFVTIYDFLEQKIIYQIPIKNKEIIGRLKSNLYQFIGGHIYFGNKVVKVRYDLIENQKADYKEYEVFDIYNSVMNLKSKYDSVQSGLPLISCEYNRLAYMVNNMKRLTTRKLIILPYLHERKIVLNRRHNTDQFYTITKVKDRNFILCMSINSDKMYLYSETGILCEKIDYYDVVEIHGKPHAVSENGKVMIFKKCHKSNRISVCNISHEGVQIKISRINIKDKIQEHIDNLPEVFPENEFMFKQKQYGEQITNFWNNYLKKLESPKQVLISYEINDKGDVLARLKPTDETIVEIMQDEMFQVTQKDSILECSFFLYIPANKENKDFIYFDSEYDEINQMRGASLNDKFVFFWNQGNVWSIDLNTRVMKKLSIHIQKSMNESQAQIRRVRCGSDPNKIAIRVTQSINLDCILYWDVKKGSEIDCYDVSSHCMTFQDEQGSLFIIDQDMIINAEVGCRLKTYQTKISDFDWNNSKFHLLYGYRIDQKTHNWIILRNVINLSFSYMTFVIKDNFEKNSYAMNDYLFDIEGYNYTLNRMTIFTENNGYLLQQDFQKISFILKNYLELDPKLLEFLHYKDGSGKLPLHYAVQQNNTRVVNVLLKYMAKINYAAVLHIQDIFKELINYQNFDQYLFHCPFQTIQMINKQTLKQNNVAQSEILQCQPNQCSYIDDHFYKTSMQEDVLNKKALTYACSIKCVRADWIIGGNGRVFLKEMLRQKNKAVFMTPYIMIVIEFLYSKYSEKIMNRLMPPFMLHLVSVFFLVYLSEQERNAKAEAIENEFDMATIQHYEKDLVQIICCVLNIINLIIYGIQTYHLQWMQFKRPWAYLDFLQLSANLVVSSSLFTNIDLLKLRIFEAMLMIMMMLKVLYFLRLIGEIAPLIDIIFQICFDIRYFIMIFFIADIAFMCSFFSIGKNQEQLADGDEDLIPVYSTYTGALMHVYESSLGNYDTEYYMGNEMSPYLFTMFFAMSFFMCIHLLNMLIAIMGDSFSQNKDNKEANKRISQLAFVVDNWWIDPITDKEKIVYLIAAFKVEDQNETETERFERIEERITGVQKAQDKIIQCLNELRDQNMQIFQIISQK